MDDGNERRIKYTDIKAIPFQMAHLDLIIPNEEDIKRYGGISSDMEHPMAEFGTAFSGVFDGRILLCGGVFQCSTHTGHCWTIISKHAKKYPLAVVKAIKYQLENMMRDMRLHRLETANIAEAGEHHKWCRLMGFEAEGVLRYYDDQKRDYIRYAKIMEI